MPSTFSANAAFQAAAHAHWAGHHVWPCSLKPPAHNTVSNSSSITSMMHTVQRGPFAIVVANRIILRSRSATKCCRCFLWAQLLEHSHDHQVCSCTCKHVYSASTGLQLARWSMHHWFPNNHDAACTILFSVFHRLIWSVIMTIFLGSLFQWDLACEFSILEINWVGAHNNAKLHYLKSNRQCHV